jgi:hypothetical protein
MITSKGKRLERTLAKDAKKAISVMSTTIGIDVATTALPTTATMSSRLATTGSIIANSRSSATATSSNPYQELLERVIRRENTSVIRVVWYVIEQTKRGHKEVEASYSQLQTALNLSRCGVSLGVSRALEAGYIVRANNNNTTGSGYGSGKGRTNGGDNTGNNRGVGGDHATARYVVNLPLPPATPDPPVGDMQSDNQTSNDSEDKAVAAADGSNKHEQEGELLQEQFQLQTQQGKGSVNQTVLNSHSFLFSDLSPDSNIESFIELESPVEIESLVPVSTSVGKADHQPAGAETEGTAQAAADDEDEEEEGNGDDNQPDSSLHTAPTSTSEPQEQPHAQERAEAEAEAGVEAGAGARARSEYLANLSQDFSRELGDLAHGRSNSTQIHNLWRESGLSEKEFAGLLYQSRDLTRRYAVLRPGETPPPSGKPRNRMAYFFTVVRNMLGLGSATTAPVAIASATSASASATTPTQISTRPNPGYGYNADEYEYKQNQTQAQTHKLPKTGSSMVSPQTQVAGLRQAPGASSGASVSAAASASSTASWAWSRSSRYQERTRANDNAKVQAEKARGQAQGKAQAVAPNGVKLLHASWLQFIR